MKTSLIAALIAAAGLAVHAQAITDAQIAAIVLTANQVDIDAGKLAGQMAKDAHVRAFGNRMVSGHTSVNTSAVALVTKLMVTPVDNPTSMALKDGGAKNVASLRMLKGAAFDKAYVDHEVAYHEQVLDAVDNVLIPGAKNDEVKARLVKVRPAFAEHLEHAKHLQSMMMSH